MQDAFLQFLKSIGEDPNRAGLKKTPERWEAALRELTKGYDQSLEDVVDSALFPAESSEMVIMKNVRFHSLCEHHILPFYGTIHVGYLPGKNLIGFSKIPRIVDMYTHRLQTQERLGSEIADALQKTLQPKGIGVVITATHLCMRMRGVKEQETVVTTHHFRGELESGTSLREEFLHSLK